jgi:hypothetical protein
VIAGDKPGAELPDHPRGQSRQSSRAAPDRVNWGDKRIRTSPSSAGGASTPAALDIKPADGVRNMKRTGGAARAASPSWSCRAACRSADAGPAVEIDRR